MLGRAAPYKAARAVAPLPPVRYGPSAHRVASLDVELEAHCRRPVEGMRIACGPCVLQFPKWGWKPALYIVTIVIALVAMVLGIREALSDLQERKRPTTQKVVMSWLLSVAFGLKAPYLWDKALSILTMAVLSLGYGAISIIDSINIAG